METLISIVVPTHNKRLDAERCVRALASQEFEAKSFEIILIDDGSQDDSPEVLPFLKTNGVPYRYFRLPGKGPAAARNEGIRQARGNIVAFVDDDAIPQPGYLKAIFSPFSSEDVAGVEGKVVPVGGEHWGLLGMSPVNLEGGVYLTCNIAFRKDVLLKIGGLDESFPYPAFEDVDLAAAAKTLGRIVWQPKAVVYHPRRRWSFGRAFKEVRFYEPLVLFARRYGYLGWKDRPTRFPALRTYLAAVLTLPGGRILTGIKGLAGKHPLQALEFISISALQGFAASFFAIPPILKGLKTPIERKHYL